MLVVIEARMPAPRNVATQDGMTDSERRHSGRQKSRDVRSSDSDCRVREKPRRWPWRDDIPHIRAPLHPASHRVSTCPVCSHHRGIPRIRRVRDRPARPLDDNRGRSWPGRFRPPGGSARMHGPLWFLTRHDQNRRASFLQIGRAHV